MFGELPTLFNSLFNLVKEWFSGDKARSTLQTFGGTAVLVKGVMRSSLTDKAVLAKAPSVDAVILLNCIFADVVYFAWGDGGA